MAKVPVDGYKMFGGPTGANSTSIYEVVKHTYGTPSGENFNAIITTCQSLGNINDFDPAYRPASLSALNDSDDFRNFPVTAPATGVETCLITGTGADDSCCSVFTPCPPPEKDEPLNVDPVTLYGGSSASDVCCNIQFYQ